VDRARSTKARHPEVRRSRVGRGVFARRFYREGEIIGEILGTVIDRPDYSSAYCYSMGDDRSLEPDPPFRFLNHGCQPNSAFQWFDVRSVHAEPLRRRVFVMALEPIRAGAEITIDYRWPAAMAIRCRCGSPGCRGWVIDGDDLKEFLAGGREPAVD
jgi:SET domain-containing protein